MKNPENKTENATIINGVVLTEKAIEYLKGLQEDDNSFIKEISEEITQAIALLITATDYFEGENETEFQASIKYLNVFNRGFKYLMKP